FLMARLGGRRLLWVNVVSLIGNLVLAFSLIPVVGAWGAVIACAGGMAIRATQLTIGEARALHISTNELLRSLSPMLLAIIILVVLWFTIRNAELPALLLAPISAIAGTLAFIAAIHLARAGLT